MVGMSDSAKSGTRSTSPFFKCSQSSLGIRHELDVDHIQLGMALVIVRIGHQGHMIAGDPILDNEGAGGDGWLVDEWILLQALMSLQQVSRQQRTVVVWPLGKQSGPGRIE